MRCPSLLLECATLGQEVHLFKRLVSVLVWLCVCAPSSYAGEDYQRPGPYLGIGASYAIENFSLDSDELNLAGALGSGLNPKYDNSAGVDVQIGYRLDSRFAVEFLYGFLEGFDSHAGALASEIDLHLVTLNAKWFPLGELCDGRLQPYALAGVGTQIVNSEVRSSAFEKPYETDAGFVGRVGGGIDYYLTESFGVEVEASYMLPAGGWVRHARYTAVAFHFLHRF
jgi:opacity protein-like surface antigen